jgi:hypothetical protein
MEEEKKEIMHKVAFDVPEQCMKCDKFMGFSVYLKDINQVVYHCPETIKILKAFMIYNEMNKLSHMLTSAAILSKILDL